MTTNTGAIAPHEGRELELVKSGSKPLAVIEKRKQPEAYREAIRFCADALGMTGVVRIDRESGPEVIVSQSAYLVEDYLQLLRDGVERLGIKGYHRAMGCLFGYSPDDVETFIDAEVDCDCSKCKGAVRQLQDDKLNREAAARRTQFHA